MNTVTINGQTFTSSGSITIRNGRVIIDGREMLEVNASTQIVINGTIGNLDTDLSVNVSGKVEGNITAGGSVNCDDVGGSVNAGGSVNCDDVGGNITAGGSIRRG